MKERTRKIFIMIVMAALIVSLMAASFAALTYGRYSGGRRDENSAYDDDILDLVGETAFEVSTADELVNAINNGYSYIKIADDAEEPFVINNNVADVYTNLVLDVNGHVVVRNSRNPLLDVRRSISVVLVYDSSFEADGGFYNPVGSSLQTSGGTLTVGEGVYESGPNVEAVPHVTTAEISDVFVRNGERASATKYQKATAAVQLPKPGKDVYLDETYSGTKNDCLKADTYLLYTVEKNGYVDGGQLYVNAKKITSGETTTITADKFSPICNVASCDFYYYYPVDADGSPIDTEGTQDTPQTYAVIYGYNDVKALASNKNDAAKTLQKSGLVWPYAAIRSVEDEDTQEGGVTHARGGVFKTHFGEENTYCIYSAGGTMTVGTSGSDGGPTFDAVGSGVCIAMTGASDNVSEGGSLTISGGTFSSRLGNTIEMENGNMTVTAGTFTKSRGKGIGSGDNAQITNQTAIIDIQGGTLTINGAAANSVTLTAGSADTDNGGTLENVFGILARGGEVSVGGCTLNIYGDYSAGVLSYDGTINLNDKTSITVTQSDTNKDNDNNTLLTSSAVSSEAGSSEAGGEEHPINMSGNVTIESNGLGITARGAVNVTEGTTTVTTPRGTGIYVNNGTFTVESRATISVESTVLGYAWGLPPEGEGTRPNIYNGVYVQGGSLVSNGKLNVTFTGVENDESGDYLTQQIKSYAVRVEAAASGSDTEVSIAGGEISNSVGGGVYVGGGTVTLGVKNGNKGPTVQTTGKLLYTSWLAVVGGSWKYMLNKSGGHAVEVSGGSLTVHGGNYTAQQGNGILIRNTSQSQVTNTVMINSGSFLGYNSGYYISQNNKPLESTERMVGPAASYGLNVMGHDLDVRINGGEFGNNEGDVGNSAASFFGTPDGSRPQVAVHGGTFNANNADAISVFRFIDITFDGTASKISSNISNGAVASLSVQDDLLYTGESDRGSTIEIQSGTFTGTAYGIWYACGYDKLSISGDATIEGSTGLQVHSAPVENGIAISGGTIEGGTEGIYYNDSASVESEGYGLNITGGTIRGTGNNKNGHALNIVVEPKTHAIHIGGTAQLFGGRDAIYVNNAGDDENDKNAVSITGGTFKGAEQDTTSGDYGCAIWFNSGMNDSVYQITGGTFITKDGGSAIGTINPNVYELLRILPDGYLLTDRGGKTYDRDKYFRDIDGISEITVSMS